MNKKERKERNNRIKEMYETGMTQIVIAQKENLSLVRINQIIKGLKEEGKIDEEKQAKAKAEKRAKANSGKVERNNRIKEMYETGITQRAIAQKENLSKGQINQIIKRVKIGKNYILTCKNNSKGNDEKQDTAKLRQSIELDYDKVTMDDIIFVINVHLKQHEYQNVIVFLNSLISFEEMKQIDKYSLKEMKKQVEYIREVNKVRQLLRKGLSKQDIKQLVKLSECEINQIANKLKQGRLNVENRIKTENDDIENNGR